MDVGHAFMLGCASLAGAPCESRSGRPRQARRGARIFRLWLFCVIVEGVRLWLQARAMHATERKPPGVGLRIVNAHSMKLSP